MELLHLNLYNHGESNGLLSSLVVWKYANYGIILTKNIDGNKWHLNGYCSPDLAGKPTRAANHLRLVLMLFLFQQ